METLGQYLKQERETKKVTLEHLSKTTKIGVRLLKDLEEDNWQSLPPGAFVRGFLRSYANALGVPPEEIMRRYQKQIPQELSGRDLFEKFRGFEVKNRFFLILLLAVGMILLAAYFSSR